MHGKNELYLFDSRITVLTIESCTRTAPVLWGSDLIEMLWISAFDWEIDKQKWIESDREVKSKWKFGVKIEESSWVRVGVCIGIVSWHLAFVWQKSIAFDWEIDKWVNWQRVWTLWKKAFHVWKQTFFPFFLHSTISDIFSHKHLYLNSSQSKYKLKSQS